MDAIAFLALTEELPFYLGAFAHSKRKISDAHGIAPSKPK